MLSYACVITEAWKKNRSIICQNQPLRGTNMSKSVLENLIEVIIIFTITTGFMLALGWAADKEKELGIHGQSSASIGEK